MKDGPDVKRPVSPALGVLWNPAAGGNRRRQGLFQRVIQSLPVQAHRQAVTPDEVASALAALANEGIDTLLISGGDGTIQAAMTCLFEQRPFPPLPDVILLPSGTTNMDAQDLGLPGNPARALKRLRRAGGDHLKGLIVRERPILRIAHGTHRHYGLFFGTGLIAEAVDYFQHRIRRWSFLGEAGSLLASLRTLASLVIKRRDPIPMTLTWDSDPPREGGWALVLMTSLERVLFRTRPYHDSGSGSGHMTAARYPLRRSLWALIRRGTAGQEAERQGLCSGRIDALTLTLDGDYVVDGETYPARKSDGPINVTIAEERIRFLVPG